LFFSSYSRKLTSYVFLFLLFNIVHYFLLKLAADLLKEQLQRQRRQSFLFAKQLEREHQKARVALAMSPAQLSLVQKKEKEIDQGCQVLLSLLTRLHLQHQYKHFRKRNITYERAKNLSAREFSMLGLTHAESLRLANTLCYAAAVQKSYVDVKANDQKSRDQGQPLLFKDDPQAQINRLMSPLSSAQKKKQRRLSALGRDLLDVFDTQLKNN
jgi:hypothetical protein